MNQTSLNASAKYARALFEQAKEEDKLTVIHDEVLEFQAVFADIPDLAHALTDIRLDFAQKELIFSELVEFASPLMQSFMKIVFANKRMDIMPFIYEDFIKRYNAHAGIIQGTITSAVALDAAQKEKIERSVAKKFGIDEIVLQEKIDETIVGGVIVEAQNKIIDGSVKTQMTKLRNLLK